MRNELKARRQMVIDLFKGNRGLDLFKCFKDMSIKHASEICGLCFSTFKMLRYEKVDSRWFFIKLKSGDPAYTKKWDEIKLFRECMMLEEDFKDIRDILRHAAEFGAAMRKIFVPKARPVDEASAFKKGVLNTRPHIPIVPLLNNRDRLRAWSQQQQRLVALTQEAIQLVATLPPPVPITVPAPQQALQNVVPPPTPVAPAPAPAPEPVAPLASPPQAPEKVQEIVRVNSWSQLSDERWVLESVAKDPTAKKATPRDINKMGPPQDWAHKAPAGAMPVAMPSKEVQLRPGMLVFDQAMEELKNDAVQRRLTRVSDRTPTPLHIVFPDIGDLGVVRFPKKHMLGPGPESDILPTLQPITDWSWLHTMGLASS